LLRQSEVATPQKFKMTMIVFGGVGRKCSEKSDVIEESSSTFKNFQPTVQKKHHDSNQLRKIVEKDGVQISASMARNRVREIARTSTFHNFEEMSMLPSYMKQRKSDDPEGTYIVSSETDASGAHRFLTAYRATSVAKKQCPKLNSVFSIDGASCDTLLQGTILILVGRSANKNLVLLAEQYCASEDTEGVSLFLQRCVENFPRLLDKDVAMVNDKGPAIAAACAEHGIKTRMCVYHIKKYTLTKDFTYSNTAMDLGTLLDDLSSYASCITLEEAVRWEKEKKQENQKWHEPLQYIIGRREEFVDYFLLEKGINSHGLQNSMAESVFKTIKPDRALSVISMFNATEKKFHEKFVKRKEQALEAEKDAFGKGVRKMIVAKISDQVEAKKNFWKRRR
jgi:hypothetical protein